MNILIRCKVTTKLGHYLCGKNLLNTVIKDENVHKLRDKKTVMNIIAS